MNDVLTNVLTGEETRVLTHEELSNEELLALVIHRLVNPTLRDEKLARQVCEMAGILVRRNEKLQATLKEWRKSKPRWSKGQLSETLVLYAHLQMESDPKTARGLLRKFKEQQTGKQISDKTIQNILSEAAKTIPLEDLPDDIRPTIEKRLDRGKKTRHRGVE